MYTILVVDDNPSIVDIFVNMLQQRGYATLTATSGEQALQILKNTRPDMILLDIMMEPLDGWQTLERIKAGPPRSPQSRFLCLLQNNLRSRRPKNSGFLLKITSINRSQEGHYTMQ